MAHLSFDSDRLRTIWLPSQTPANAISQKPQAPLSIHYLYALAERFLPKPKTEKTSSVFGEEKDIATEKNATQRRGTVGLGQRRNLRSTFATRLSAGGVADEWLTQL